MNIHRIALIDPDYPVGLRLLPDPPKAIYMRGERDILKLQPSLAIVGSRKMSACGKSVTQQLATAVAGQGILVVSGLALGLDAEAHKATLEAGGKALAILASGVDLITPATNYWLGQAILRQGGALLSEYPPGTPARKHHFVARNRLVAGLSNAVLIPEATARSGSLHTAAFALDQGKPVLAVPGDIRVPQSEGTNKLLKTGAIPVTGPADIFLCLGISSPKTKSVQGTTPEEIILLELLADGLTNGQELLLQSGLAAPLFNQTLTMLEIGGKVQALGNNHWGPVG